MFRIKGQEKKKLEKKLVRSKGKQNPKREKAPVE